MPLPMLPSCHTTSCFVTIIVVTVVVTITTVNDHFVMVIIAGLYIGRALHHHAPVFRHHWASATSLTEVSVGRHHIPQSSHWCVSCLQSCNFICTSAILHYHQTATSFKIDKNTLFLLQFSTSSLSLSQHKKASHHHHHCALMQEHF